MNLLLNLILATIPATTLISALPLSANAQTISAEAATLIVAAETCRGQNGDRVVAISGTDTQLPLAISHLMPLGINATPGVYGSHEVNLNSFGSGEQTLLATCQGINIAWQYIIGFNVDSGTAEALRNDLPVFVTLLSEP